jgi:CheY-like chemotaxis protein
MSAQDFADASGLLRVSVATGVAPATASVLSLRKCKSDLQHMSVLSYIEYILILNRLMAQILLVEDDVDVQIVVSEFLAMIGHAVISASSATQARRALADAPFDLAVIDCLLTGEQGNSFAEHVRKLGIPAILTSGDPHYLEMLAEQPLPFLPKPFRLGELAELVSQLLKAPAA